jgi:hypothetical protein
MSHPAAQNRLFAEQVGFRLFLESCLDNPCFGTADRRRIAQGCLPCLAAGIVAYRYQAGYPVAELVLAAYRVSRSFGSHHGYVDIGGGFYLAEMDVETVGEHHGLSRAQGRGDILLIDLCLKMVRY